MSLDTHSRRVPSLGRSHAPSRAPSRTTSRAASTRPTTRDDGDWVVAVIDSRGTGREVGVAMMERDLGQVIVTQYADSPTYVKSLHQFTSRPPSIILVPPSFLGAKGNPRRDGGQMALTAEATVLVKSLRDAFKDTPIVPVQRGYWNEQAGYEFLTSLIVHDKERHGTILAAKSRYYALSAISALFKYLEASHALSFPVHSLRIRYVPIEGTCFIDNETAANLELVTNGINKSSKQHLLGLLDQCYTPMGSRLLRTNILGPLTNVETIDTRLDAVEEMVRSEERFTTIRKALEPLKGLDLDKLIAQIVASRPHAGGASDPSKDCEQKIQRVLQLRTILSVLPALRSALANADSTLLRTARYITQDPRLDELFDEISSTINADAIQGLQKGALAARSTRLYAVRAEKKLLLEVARETYKENVDDAFELCEELGRQHGVELGLHYAQNGFVLTCPAAEWDERKLSRSFTNINRKGKKVEFMSLELKKKNLRIAETVQEVFLLSDEIMDKLLAIIRTDIACLYRVAEGIAIVDMLAAFADIATKNNYTRPEWIETLAIKSGRHPLLEQFRFSDGSFVPNDTYASDAASFQIVGGANMSGKSTLLRQIALLYVMAQIGSFVPAEYASFRIVGAILSRLSNDDSIEASMSTFSKEMSTMAFLISAMRSYDQSLVLVDELGRGTSPEEGIGIAHALAENIIKTKAFCFFATHFKELTMTLGRYPNVVCLHLETDVDCDAPDFALKFHHRAVDGPAKAEHYGLELAKVAKLPSDVLVRAKSVVSSLSALTSGNRQQDSDSSRLAFRRKLVLQLRTTLKELSCAKNISTADLVQTLRDVHEDMVDSLVQTALIDQSVESQSDISERHAELDVDPKTSQMIKQMEWTKGGNALDDGVLPGGEPEGYEDLDTRQITPPPSGISGAESESMLEFDE